MRGYPKFLNTKEDYLFVKANFGKELWSKDWQYLLDTMRDWITIGEVESPEAGVTDETHRVVDGRQGEGEEAKTVYYQQELQVIPTCKLLALGFTEEEVRAALAE